MRKSKFTESQIVGILGEGEAGLPVAEVLRKHGIATVMPLAISVVESFPRYASSFFCIVAAMEVDGERHSSGERASVAG